MSRESFKFPVDPNTDRNPPHQIVGMQTIRTIMFYQNAISELQDRVEALEAWTDKDKTEEEINKEA